LDRLERYLGWIAIPQLGILLVTLQAAGFIFVMMDPEWITRLALVPGLVSRGEVWRLVTFLALPVSLSPLWVFFALWFLYFVLGIIESEWGAFKTTLYTLVSVLVTIAFSFAFNYPVASVSHFQSTLFLAAAALYPEQEVSLFGIVPVKMKWLAAFTLVLVGIEFFRGDWVDRLFLVAIFSNYLLFFGPALLGSARQRYRAWDYRRRLR
jgi:membrane associated rhomboid family serine protease